MVPNALILGASRAPHSVGGWVIVVIVVVATFLGTMLLRRSLSNKTPRRKRD